MEPRYSFVKKNKYISLQLFLIFIFVVCTVQADFKVDKDIEKLTGYIEEIKRAIGLDTIQKTVSELKFEEPYEESDLSEQVEAKAEEIWKKADKYLKVVQRLLEVPKKDSDGELSLCCGYDESKLNINNSFDRNLKVNVEEACEVVSHDSQVAVKSASKDLIAQMSKNFDEFIDDDQVHLKWQYVATEEGVLTVFPALNFSVCPSSDPRFRPWYIEISRPQVRNIVVQLDMSQSMETGTYTGKRLFSLSLEVIDILFEMLDPRDNIAFVGFNNNPVDGPFCFKKGFVKANRENKKLLKEFLNNVKPKGQSRYKEAFDKTFDIFNSSPEVQNGTNILMILTDGKPNEYHGSISTLYDFVEENVARLKNSHKNIKFFIVGLGRNVKTQILSKIASFGDSRQFGNISLQLKEAGHLRNSMSVFLKINDSKPVISLPYIDEGDLGLICTIGSPFYDNKTGLLLGIVATDVSIDSLFQSVRDFYNDDSSYAFVIDTNGVVFLHYLLPKPRHKHERPTLVYINQLECLENDGLFQRMVTENKGSQFQSSENCSRSFPEHSKNGTMYHWSRIGSTSLILVVKVSKLFRQKQKLMVPEIWNYNLTKKQKEFIYHRIDLNQTYASCTVYDRRAIISMATVQMSKYSFKDSHSYLLEPETTENIELYYKLFNQLINAENSEKAKEILKKYRTTADKFKENVVQDIIWSTVVNKLWTVNGTIDAFLFGSETGIIRILPGRKFQKDYDVQLRAWHRLAKLNPNKMVFSIPYKDAVGAGRIITVSTAIMKETEDSDGRKSSQVVGVLGLDLTLNQFRSKFQDIFDNCKDSAKRYCALVNDDGTIVYENDYVSQENLRLGHVAGNRELYSQLLSEGFIENKTCFDHASNTYKRSYKLNPDTELDFNSTGRSGTQCGRNIMHPINGTNIFFLTRQTYGFCYSIDCFEGDENELQKCRSVDGNALTESNFRCPCYYERETEIDCDLKFQYQTHHPSCSPRLPILAANDDCLPGNLKKCFDPKCKEITTREGCNSSRCVWCNKQENFDALPHPYCTYVEECYSGVEGQLLPGYDLNYICGTTDILPLGIILAISFGCFTIFCITVLTVIFLYRRWRRNELKKESHSDFDNISASDTTQNPQDSTEQGVPANAGVKTKKSQDIRVVLSVLDQEGNTLFSKPIVVQGNRRSSSVASSPNENTRRKKNNIKVKLRRQKKDSITRDELTDLEENPNFHEKWSKLQNLRRRTVGTPSEIANSERSRSESKASGNSVESSRITPGGEVNATPILERRDGISTPYTTLSSASTYANMSPARKFFPPSPLVPPTPSLYTPVAANIELREVAPTHRRGVSPHLNKQQSDSALNYVKIASNNDS